MAPDAPHEVSFFFQGELFFWRGARQSSGVYHDFYEGWRKARTITEARLLNSVHRCIEGGEYEFALRDASGRVMLDRDGNARTARKFVPPDGRLALEMLVRKFPEEYGGGGGARTGSHGSQDLLDSVIEPVSEALAELFSGAVAILAQHGATFAPEVIKLIDRARSEPEAPDPEPPKTDEPITADFAYDTLPARIDKSQAEDIEPE
jgi:hypothetical protein